MFAPCFIGPVNQGAHQISCPTNCQILYTIFRIPRLVEPFDTEAGEIDRGLLLRNQAGDKLTRERAER